MGAAAIQTLWAELIAATLADAGVQLVVLSPGSRSTPLAAAFAGEPRLELVTIIDERAAAFYALGAARASGVPAAIACTSGSAPAHYLPAIVEASAAGVPLVVLTADRPPELHAAGANQTIDQVKLFGVFARAALDLGAPEGSELALRAVRRKVAQAVTLARGPHPGPVHLEVPLRKPLEPELPGTDAERELARVCVALRGALPVSAPRLVAEDAALAALAAAITAEPRGVLAVGALPVGFPRDALFALAARSGYPILAETGSQLRFGPRPPGVRVLEHAELLRAPGIKLVVQLGAEPLAVTPAAQRWILAPHVWQDPDSSARGVVVGDLEATLRGVATRVTEHAGGWLDEVEMYLRGVVDQAIAACPGNEVAAMRAAIEASPGVTLQLGNSLPVRIADMAARSSDVARAVITQRGTSGIDGLIASAAGATRTGPVLLVLGDVSFAHDLGGLLAAREARAPLAILVIDNAGGRIFDGLPVAHTGMNRELYARCFTTAPGLDPVAVALALGARGVRADSPAAITAAVAAALDAGAHGVTVIHAPVTPTGAHDVKRTARELLAQNL